jgi:anaerobic selenocysteine-containing dehydrogenase
LIVFWGFNAAVSAPHLWRLALAARKEQGARIAAVDPVRTPTAAGADIWLRPKPGTDVALAYGIINAVVGMRAHGEAFISQWTAGFDALMEKASVWTPSAVEAATGVATDDLAVLVDAYTRHRPSATLIGIGLQKQTAGADQARAAALIPAVLGQHRGFFYSSADAHSVDMARITGKSLTDTPSPTVSQVGLAPLVARGDFPVIFVSCTNPLLTLPGQTDLRQGFRRADVFVAVHDTHWTRTADVADVVLPALTYLEKDDLVIPWSHSRIRRSRRIVDPITDGWDEVILMQEMARRLGRKEPWLFEDPWEALKPALEGRIRNGGVAALCAGKTCHLTRKPNDRYATQSGKIEFLSNKAKKLGFSPLPEVVETAAPGWVMLSGALPAYTHSQFQDIYGPIPATMAIHPDDADEAGIRDGDAVVLSSAGGAVTVSAVVSDMVPRGVVWTPRQYEDRDGVPQNVLTSSSPQVIGGGATFNATRVTVTRSPG